MDRNTSLSAKCLLKVRWQFAICGNDDFLFNQFHIRSSACDTGTKLRATSPHLPCRQLYPTRGETHYAFDKS